MLEIIEVLKYVLPSLVVLATSYLVLSSYLNNQFKMKGLEVAMGNNGDSLGIRLQAYERLALYLERINPHHLIARTHQADITVPEMQMILIANVRAEFDHNITQQLYVSNDLWTLVKAVTEETISIITGVAQELPTDASGSVLSRAVLEYFITADIPMPTDKALVVLKNEARELL